MTLTVDSGQPVCTCLSDVPVIEGPKAVYRDFERLPQWGRVLPVLLAQSEAPPTELGELMAFGQGLDGRPFEEQMFAIQTGINRRFDYVEDASQWGEEDYWEVPEEMVASGRMDCEGFSILKLFVGLAAGIPFDRMSVWVGLIPSTGQFHAILAVTDGERTFLLDNRTAYIVDVDTIEDFIPNYAVSAAELWV